jgi:cytochrome c oxidase subunit 2
VPGNKNFMWIQADESGEYLGQCAEFCGEAHALMRFRVVAEPRGDFDAWLAGEAAAAEEPVEPLAQQGKALFEGSKAQCWSCHSVTGSSKSRGQTGPNLTHVSSRSHIAAGVIENTQESLRQWLEDPQSIKQGTIMYRDAKIYNDPDNKLTDADVAALVAYLQTLE